MGRDLEVTERGWIQIDSNNAISCYGCAGREYTYGRTNGNGYHREITNYCDPDSIDGSHPANATCPLGFQKNPSSTHEAPVSDVPEDIFRRMVKNGFTG